jgi:hypothetical protein
MRYVILTGVLFFHYTGKGQTAHLPVTNGYLTAGAYSNHFIDAFSFTANPACLGDTKMFLGGVITERKWMLAALDNYELAASACLGNGGIGMLFRFSGDADYREQTGELAYGKNLGQLQLGTRFGITKIAIPGYPGPLYGYAGMGLRFHITENLISGWELDLPCFSSANISDPERAPQIFRMGFGYEWGKDLFLGMQLVKVSGIPVNITGSIEYKFDDRFFFSFGINTGNGSPVFQSGWEKNQLCIQIYTAYEPVLGFSPGLVLLWRGKNKKG